MSSVLSVPTFPKNAAQSHEVVRRPDISEFIEDAYVDDKEELRAGNAQESCEDVMLDIL